MTEIKIKVMKKDSALWLGIVDNKVVLKNKDYDTLVMKLGKKYPTKMPTILASPLCETLIL